MSRKNCCGGLAPPGQLCLSETRGACHLHAHVAVMTKTIILKAATKRYAGVSAIFKLHTYERAHSGDRRLARRPLEYGGGPPEKARSQMRRPGGRPQAPNFLCTHRPSWLPFHLPAGLYCLKTCNLHKRGRATPATLDAVRIFLGESHSGCCRRSSSHCARTSGIGVTAKCKCSCRSFCTLAGKAASCSYMRFRSAETSEGARAAHRPNLRF